jgi:hypothetical protein
MPLASFSSSSSTVDNLVGGENPVLSRQITLISGQNLVRGAVLGKITTGGKYNLSLSGAGDGSQTPDAILAEACDASAGDKVTAAYFNGDFQSGGLTLGTAHTAASITEGLRAKGINIVVPQITY